jgi:hypothetical protein
MAKPPKKSTEQNITAPEHIKKEQCISGSISPEFTKVLTNQAFQSMWRKHSDEAALKTQYAMALSAMAGMKPQDEMEGMIITQMLGLHNAAMECMRRAMLDNQSAVGEALYLNQANKLTRSYAQLMQALDKHRGKATQQKVTVEHVHVHEGGQAIVGAVAQNRGEGKPEK